MPNGITLVAIKIKEGPSVQPVIVPSWGISLNVLIKI